jgi:hypothetical protein
LRRGLHRRCELALHRRLSGCRDAHDDRPQQHRCGAPEQKAHPEPAPRPPFGWLSVLQGMSLLISNSGHRYVWVPHDGIVPIPDYSGFVILISFGLQVSEFGLSHLTR